MLNDSASTISSMTRRQFIRKSALAAGTLAVTRHAFGQARKINSTDKLRIAAVGASGKGSSDIDCCANEHFVAICDVNSKLAAPALEKHPQAKFYYDWREMLEKEEKNIDAVIVSTPDHLHASVASAAMKLGKHVYCQKPLTQTVHEARYLRDLAKEQGVVTQMGNQGSAEDGLRRAVEIVQAGVIGPVKQIHVWTNRPIWPQGVTRPEGEDPVPETFKWDLWLGPAPYRSFKDKWNEESTTPTKRGRRRGASGAVYAPFNWRGWFDFGTGALGDMACHTANLPFRAAKLGYPKLVELLDHSELNPDTYPKTSKIRFVFPERQGLPETEFFWYDGNPDDRSVKPLRPPEDITAPIKELQDNVPSSGCLLVGQKGILYSGRDYGEGFYIKLNDEKELVNGETHEAAKAVPVTIPRNQHQGDGDHRHHLEWIAACKGGPVEPYSNFGIAAYLTEIILLGCVALRVGKKLDWDGPEMRARNAPEASRYVKRDFRKGWHLA
jgi:hypothetical protein